MNSRVVNLCIFVLILVQFVTGLLGLIVSTDSWRIVFIGHDILGMLVIALLFWKVQIALRSLAKRPGHSGQKALSLVGSVFLLLTLATGILWVLRLTPVRTFAGITLVSLHIYISAALGLLFAAHALTRWPRPKRTDFARRRAFMGLAGATAAAVTGWWLLELLSPFTAKAQGVGHIVARRFTGSRNAQAEWNLDSTSFPQTQLLFDNPDPVDQKAWQLHITGNVEQSISLGYDAFTNATDQVTAVLDCTSGWYSEQTWRGVPVGQILDRTVAGSDAKFVIFRSITGYAWPIPLDEARNGLLATHVAGAPLSHGHGFPLRVVLPGRRGLQWVKWLSEIEVV